MLLYVYCNGGGIPGKKGEIISRGQKKGNEESTPSCSVQYTDDASAHDSDKS